MNTTPGDWLSRESRRLHGNLVVAACLWGQRRVPFSSRRRIDARRDAAVRRIVRYAARTVPYYRDLFRREGIGPETIRGARDLARLPLLERGLVREHPELFVSTGRRARGALPFLTSGSTGSPLEVRHDRRSLLANIAFGERERQPLIALCGGSFSPKEVYIGYETSNFRKVLRFYEENTRLPIRPRRITVPMTAPFERIVESINLHRPDVLTAYGGFVDLFFRSVAARGAHLHLPKVVMYVGETLEPERRAWIEGRFGVRVLSRYCAAEAFKIGYFCEEATGFHLHEDICHVRIVGDDGQDKAPGEAGQVVVSNLVNRATVLLNYPMGDVAKLSMRTCPCGRRFRLLSELEGRVEDALALPGGDFLHPRAVWSVLKDETDVLQYQLVQHELRRFELKLVTVDANAFPAAAERMARRLGDLMGRGAHIDVTQHSELGRRERETTGKFRAVESRCRFTGDASPR